LQTVRHVASDFSGSAERFVTAATGPAARLFGSSSAGSQAKVSPLEAQVVRLRAELSQAQLSQRELSQLLQLSGRGGYRIVAANVIAYGQAYQQTVTLDAGRGTVGAWYIRGAVFQIAVPVIWLIVFCFRRFRPVVTALVLVYVLSLVLQFFSYI